MKPRLTIFFTKFKTIRIDDTTGVQWPDWYSNGTHVLTRTPWLSTITTEPTTTTTTEINATTTAPPQDPRHPLVQEISAYPYTMVIYGIASLLAQLILVAGLWFRLRVLVGTWIIFGLADLLGILLIMVWLLGNPMKEIG